MESLDELREVMTCVVCLDTLSPKVIQCSRGHALCHDCRQDQLRCPSCRKPFLLDKPTLLCQIAAIVRGQCKFQGCTYIREDKNDDHQLWCGFMPTDCKLCNWSGYGKDILSHVQDVHQDALVFTGSDNLMQKLNYCIRSKQSYVPFSGFGLFVWLQIKVLNMDWENRLSVLALQVCLIPNGKIDRDLYFNIEFKSEDCNYDVRKKIQLKMLPKEVPNEKSCIFIPSSVYDNGNGMLRINIIRNQVQIRNIQINYSTNYNFKKLCDLYVTLKNHIVEVTASEVIILTWVLLCCVLLSVIKF